MNLNIACPIVLGIVLIIDMIAICRIATKIEHTENTVEESLSNDES